MAGSGTKDDPWQLTTANGGSQYQMWRDEAADPPTLVCQVGGTQLKYQLRAIDDLAAWLKEQGDWVPLGGADEQKPAPDGTVEAWGRSESNPVGGWYGMKKGCAAGSASTCRRCSRRSAWPSSSTTPRTTGCGRADRLSGSAHPGRASCTRMSATRSARPEPGRRTAQAPAVRRAGAAGRVRAHDAHGSPGSPWSRRWSRSGLAAWRFVVPAGSACQDTAWNTTPARPPTCRPAGRSAPASTTSTASR